MWHAHQLANVEEKLCNAQNTTEPKTLTKQHTVQYKGCKEYRINCINPQIHCLFLINGFHAKICGSGSFCFLKPQMAI